ncbi:MAG: TAXI family TRAP transporter solute-binding subunit [Lachnospiraceae bacterium]|nr:TAXI family TRAP transporter solute-binding subunit [Lachnospiraceae bacterium]
MKKILALVLGLAMVLSLAACGSSNAAPAPAAAESKAESTAAAASSEAQAPAAEKQTGGGGDLTFATGGESGTYYAFGTVLAQHVSDKTDTNVTAIVGNGSQANIEDLDAGAVQLGFCQSDVMSYAYTGTNLFEESGAVGSFSVVAALYMEQVQIVTMNPDIKSVADLEGKNVSIGASGSGVYFNALDVLGVYGLTEESINAQYLNFADSADNLKDGKIDAAFIVAGAPTTAITDLAAGGRQVYLVSLDDEHAEQLIAKSPYYSKYTIPADVYGTPEDVTTVAVGAIVIARDDVADGDVYNFVSSIFENLDEVEAGHAKGAELSLDFASSITDVPYHPGAAKYFEEKGITVSTK